MFRKNVAGQAIGFAGINASTGAAMAGTTGFAAYRVLDNGTQATATGTVVDKGNGHYAFVLSQADTNANVGSYLFAMTGMVSVEKTIVFTVLDPTVASLGLVLAKTTNITGLNDIAATAIVSGGAINTASGAVSSVTATGTTTTLTNLPAIPNDWLTAAGVKADAVAKIQTGLSTYAGGPVASVIGNVGGNVAGSVGSVTAPVTAGTVSDKTGYSGTATNIPASFTSGTFASPGVFATAALANAPSGGGGSVDADAIAEAVVTYVFDGTEPENSLARILYDSFTEEELEQFIESTVNDAPIETTGNITQRKAMALILAALAGIVSVVDNEDETYTLTFKAPGTNTTRLSMLTSAAGERLSTTLSPPA